MSKAANIGNLRWAKQSAQGVVATSSVFGSNLLGGTTPKPVLTEADLLETNSRQMLSTRYRGSVAVAGDPQFVVRPNMIGSLLYAVLGAVSTSGASDPYTHTITPSTTLPWWTFWRMVANLIWERDVDCKVTKLVLHGEYGGTISATASIAGLKPQSETAEETTATIELGNEFLHSNGSGALLLEGAAVASIDQWDLTIDRGGAPIGGDSLTPIDVSEGAFMVTLAIRRLLLAASLRNRLVYGTASPSAHADAVATILALAGSPAGAQFTFTRVAAAPGPERSLKLSLPNVVVQPYDVDPAPSTDPLRESLTLQALDDGSTVPITAVVKNSRATVY